MVPGASNVAVVGCGAIGGVVAACLSRAGVPVVPVTGSPAVAEALARDGFRVRELDGSTWSAPPLRAPRVHPGDGAPDGERFDVVVVATQGTRLEPALAGMRDRLAPGAAVVCCQNGLPEERAARLVGAERVIGCVVGWGATMVEPGLYARTSGGRLQLGRPWPHLDGAVDPEPARALLGHASPAEIATDLAAIRWSKLAINCATSTIGAVGGDSLGALLRHRFARRIALEVFAEVLDVARRSGVRPAPVSGTFEIEKVAITPAERALRFGSSALALKHSLLLAVGFKYRRMRSSMLYALERGRPPEIDHLNGEIVRRGEATGAATPVNARLVDEVHAIARGETKPALARLRAVYDEVIVGPSARGEAAA